MCSTASRLALVVWLACAFAASAAEEAPPEAASAPPAARDWSERPDFAALRAEYGARDDFAQICELQRPIREAFEQMEGKRWSELLALTGAWVERCPIDMDAHVLRAIALDQSGRGEEGAHHHAWARSLFETVLATGDGKSEGTAYQVIAVFEEYSMLRFFGWRPKGQALTENGLDAMTVEADGEERTVYFDPAASFERMRRELGDRVEPE